MNELVIPEPERSAVVPTVTPLSASETQALIASVRCAVVADDGAQCQRFLHPDNPDAHDFVAQDGTPVDGGRHWSRWIKMVHAVRDCLLDQVENVTNDAGVVVGQQRFYAFDNDAAVLADIAEAVGLVVQRTEGEPTRITEA